MADVPRWHRLLEKDLLTLDLLDSPNSKYKDVLNATMARQAENLRTRIESWLSEMSIPGYGELSETSREVSNLHKKAFDRYTSQPKTEPEVFIVESVAASDEEEGLFEGQALATVLRMCGKRPIYRHIRTERELEHAAEQFKASRYRFLHLSAHGNSRAIALTLQNVSYERFSEIFRGALRVKRLFVSACKVGNVDFANAVSKRNKGMHSILAPSIAIDFDAAVAFWAAFYVAVFQQDDDTMKSKDMEEIIQRACNLFAVKFFFARYKSAPNDEWVTREFMPE